MVTALCAAPGCDRRWMRTVQGERFCLWHPTETPPEVDCAGNLRKPEKARPLRSTTRTPPRKVTGPVAPKPLGPCVRTDGCVRPAPHSGLCNVPRQVPADGLCLDITCGRPYAHGGWCARPLDAQAIVDRYAAGESAARIAADLKVKPHRIGDLLAAAGVTRRTPAEAIQAVRAWASKTSA